MNEIARKGAKGRTTAAQNTFIYKFIPGNLGGNANAKLVITSLNYSTTNATPHNITALTPLGPAVAMNVAINTTSWNVQLTSEPGATANNNLGTNDTLVFTDVNGVQFMGKVNNGTWSNCNLTANASGNCAIGSPVYFIGQPGDTDPLTLEPYPFLLTNVGTNGTSNFPLGNPAPADSIVFAAQRPGDPIVLHCNNGFGQGALEAISFGYQIG